MVTELNYQTQSAQPGTRYLVQLRGAGCRAGQIVKSNGVQVVRSWLDSFSYITVYDAEWVVDWQPDMLGFLPRPEFKVMVTLDFTGTAPLPFDVLVQPIHEPCDPLFGGEKTGHWRLDKVYRVNTNQTRVNDIAANDPAIPADIRVGAKIDNVEEQGREALGNFGETVADGVRSARLPFILAMLAIVTIGAAWLFKR